MWSNLWMFSQIFVEWIAKQSLRLIQECWYWVAVLLNIIFVTQIWWYVISKCNLQFNSHSIRPHTLIIIKISEMEPIILFLWTLLMNLMGAILELGPMKQSHGERLRKLQILSKYLIISVIATIDEQLLINIYIFIKLNFLNHRFMAKHLFYFLYWSQKHLLHLLRGLKVAIKNISKLIALEYGSVI